MDAKNRARKIELISKYTYIYIYIYIYIFILVPSQWEFAPRPAVGVEIIEKG